MGLSGSLTLSSYKLRFFDSHVRAVPARSDGCPFEGPGVDVRGPAALSILAAAAPVHAWLSAREPGVVLRTFSLARSPSGTRVLVTLEPSIAGDRPRVLRFDDSHADELAAAAASAEALVVEACLLALARRTPR